MFHRKIFITVVLSVFVLQIVQGQTNEYVRIFNNFGKLQTSGNGNSLRKTIQTSESDVSRIRKLNFREIITSENSDLYHILNLNYNISDSCRNDLASIPRAAASRNQKWASKMIDAAGKPPSGLTEGNLLWLGSFDECHSIKNIIYKDNLTSVPVHAFNGQYCTVSLPLSSQSIELGNIPALIEGICVPDTCSQTDISVLLYELITIVHEFNLTSIPPPTVVCPPKTLDLDTKAIVAIIILSILGTFMVLGTGYDVIFIQINNNKHKSKSDIQNKSIDVTEEKLPLIKRQTEEVIIHEPGFWGEILLAFSVYTNGKKILSTKQAAGSLTSIHGIRFLSMSWVVLGHTYAFYLTYGSNTASYASDILHRWSFQAIANALVSVDTFFALSGLLVAYLTFRELEKKKGDMNWFMFYFHRFWRLTPAYMLVLMVDVCLFRYFGDGPIWPTAGPEINGCKNSWWKNLLYINNFFSMNDMCMAWSWYLSNDMQFFLICPLMILPLLKSQIAGVIVSGAFIFASFLVTGIISSHYDMPSALVGNNPSGLHYMDDYYIRPYCRIGPYIVGILTGYILHKTKCKFYINKYVNLCVWFIATVLAVVILYGLYDPDDTHQLSTSVSALYNATHRTVWGACVCWVIFACATGNGGFINTILSWSPFVPLGRLTYCSYLIHILIMYRYMMSIRETIYLSDISITYLFLGNLVLANMAAFVTSLMFEAPMMGLEKIVFRREKSKS